MANFGKSPEKSNFAQTCNLLSQFLMKGKRSLEEINAKLEAKGHETSRPAATTLDLLPSLENSVTAETSRQNDMASTSTVKSMDFFAQQYYVASASSSKLIEDTSNRVDFIRSGTVNPEAAQMTICYAGKVIVFNDFPAEKVKEIMGIAQKASNNGFNPFVSTPSMEKFNVITTDLNKCPQLEHLPLHMRPIDNGSDLPIARKNSLHRFLKKRNDRVSARFAPYERENSASHPKPDQEKKWLDL